MGLAQLEIPMARDSEGVWAVTVGPLDPGIYGYTFRIDGVRTPDMANQEIYISRQAHISMLEVSASPPAMDQYREVPHGAVHRHRYRSAVLGIERTVYVYVPPQYEADASRRFPVLYFRHGNYETEATWTGPGRANVIMDNLLAERRVIPMLIVMPNGYPGPSGEGSTTEGRALTSRELIEDIIPYIEQNYRVTSDRESRAIAGFSMGANQATYTGLKHMDRFAWIAEVSSGLINSASFEPSDWFGDLIASPGRANSQLRLLYFGCGTEDPRVTGHLNLSDLLGAAGVAHHLFTAPGGHDFRFVRLALTDLLPRLFRDSG